ncbi:MAG: hypothetical protein KDI36_05850 [Pseudomonadales bacterium]|nr:hypothetical protein [Pseudomonadales bacterium]
MNTSTSRKPVRLLLSVVFLLTLTACDSLLQKPQDTSPEQAVTEPINPNHDPEIEKLLREARVAYEADLLTTPVDNNAYLRYLQVLSIDEQEPRALAGISEIVDKYLTWALNEISAGDLHNARDYLRKAIAVDDRHPNIPAVENRLAAAESHQTRDYKLLPEELARLEEADSQKLQQIAREIEKSDARIVIYASSDSTGRKIYQYLNRFTSNRIRASFEIARTPAIRLLIP